MMNEELKNALKLAEEIDLDYHIPWDWDRLEHAARKVSKQLRLLHAEHEKLKEQLRLTQIDNSNLMTKVAELEEQTRWRHVEDELPIKKRIYQIRRKNNSYDHALFDPEGKHFVNGKGATHWRPLLELPEPKP
jgi:predicted  nucleic acid-binding Zn-ribbon protein